MRQRPSDDAAEPPEPPEQSEASGGGSGGRRGRRTLRDGRQQILLYLPPKLIKALKLAAVEEDSSVSQIVEGLVAQRFAQQASGERRDE